jgi:predicted nucleotidyltransferase
MSSKSTLEEGIRRALEPRSEIVVAYLFGSVARGESGPLSDVDVGILTSGAPPSLRARGRLSEELAREAGRRVDVVPLDQVPPEVAVRAIWEGRLLLSRDETRRVLWETDTLKRYWDAASLRRTIDRGRLRELEEGRFVG